MSRKDPRHRMVIPLTAQQRLWLRHKARGGSLADVLRHLVQHELRSDALGQGLGASAVATRAGDGANGDGATAATHEAGLPLQLPRGVRSDLQNLADRHATTPTAIIVHILDQNCSELPLAPSGPQDTVLTK